MKINSYKEKKFLVDFMAGRLARWLRILGYDTRYYRGGSTSELIYRSLKERRIVVSRNKNIDKNTAYKLFVLENDDFREQLKAVVQKFDLSVKNSKIYTRCTECNRVLEPIKKENIEEKVPGYVYKKHKKFTVCPACGKIFWRGLHRGLIEKELKNLKDENNRN